MEEAVKKAAREFTDTGASGDCAGAWEWIDTASKKLLSQAGCEKLHQLCPSPTEDLPFTVEAVRLTAPNSAVVRCLAVA